MNEVDGGPSSRARPLDVDQFKTMTNFIPSSPGTNRHPSPMLRSAHHYSLSRSFLQQPFTCRSSHFPSLQKRLYAQKRVSRTPQSSPSQTTSGPSSTSQVKNSNKPAIDQVPDKNADTLKSIFRKSQEHERSKNINMAAYTSMLLRNGQEPWSAKLPLPGSSIDLDFTLSSSHFLSTQMSPSQSLYRKRVIGLRTND